MPLGVEADALLARQRHAHGPARHAGEQRGVALDVHVLLAAERAAGGHLGDAHAFHWGSEEAGDLLPVPPNALPL